MATQRPNIVLIVTDQQRYDSLGCTGNTFAVTPNLDALAREACLFTRCITSNPVCMPSRASMMTGCYPATHGVVTNGIPLARREYVPAAGATVERDGMAVVSQLPTIGDVLAGAGYTTGSVGKLHLTPTQCSAALGYQESTALWRANEAMKQWHGPYYGLTEVEMSLGHGERVQGHYRAWLEERHPEVARELYSQRAVQRPVAGVNEVSCSMLPPELHPTAWVGDRACDFVDRHAEDEKPFFLWAGFPDPHHPYSPPAETAKEFAGHEHLPANGSWADCAGKPSAWREATENAKTPAAAVPWVRRYTDAMVHLIDRAVGRIVETLRRRELWERTILVFTSDHGDFLGDYGLLHKADVPCMPLNHVPLIVRPPGSRLPRRCEAAVSNVDFLAMACQAAGAERPELSQGRSLLETEKDGKREPVLIQTCGHEARRASVSIVDERYRFTLYPQTQERELYDHAADPWELRNVAGDSSQRAEEDRLCGHLLALHARTFAPRIGRVAIY